MKTMKFCLSLILLSVAVLAAAPASADGLITAQFANHWRVRGACFTTGTSISIDVQYLRADNSIDKTDSITITAPADRDSFFAALATSSGSDEAQLTKDGGTPDFDAINVLRISRWMIAHNYISGVTAVPTPTQ